MKFSSSFRTWKPSAPGAGSVGRGTTVAVVGPTTFTVTGTNNGNIDIPPGEPNYEIRGEATLAIEMGADAEDVGLTIHPHPTLSETIAFAAEKAEGTITDLYAPKRKQQ